MKTNMAKKKKSNDVDPAFTSCFEAAMLDYEILTKSVEDKGMVLKHHNDLKRLKKEGNWNAPWLIANYTAVCSKMSKLPRRMRDFIEYLGDNASVIWMDTADKAAAIVAKKKAEEEGADTAPKPSNEAENPKG